MNKMISGAYGLELPYNGSTKIYFPDVPQLRNKRVKHIDFCVMPNSPSGKVCAGTTDTYLTVMELNSSKQLIRDLPVSQLSVNGNRLFVNKIIDFQRTFIEYKGAASIANQSFFAVIWYNEPEMWSVINENNQRTKILPLQIKIAGLKTFFPDNLEFRNQRIVSLLLSSPSFAPDNSAVCTIFNNKFMTLSYRNLQYFFNVPLYLFDQTNNYYPIRLQGLKVDLQNSYITSLATTANDLKTVLFNAIIDDTNNGR
ncbi:MAG: hypothetical protein QM800_12715 [Paludibacter sp.]